MHNHMENPLWYRVSALRPRLAVHVRIQPQRFRQQTWYVLHNQVSGRFFRFSPTAHHLISLMDGSHSVQKIWDAANDSLGDNAPTQDETIDLLARLHSADALQSNITPDMEALFERRVQQQHQKRVRTLKNPLAIRIPLLDPDRLLGRLVPLTRPVFGLAGIVIWMVMITTAAAVATAHWEQLTDGIVDRALSPQNLFLLWLLYPLVKALHELGHGLATKVWGGEVHDMGIILIALLPVPYVDASSATGFPEKRRRIVVGAAGIMVELFLAALALLLWLNVEPGVVSALAFNVMLIGAVSTVFINGNPLLRFDGYYVFADTIDIPNLATRSKNYLGYLVQYYLLGLRDAKSPVMAPGERFWFICYGIASYLYRIVILLTIILFVAEKYLAVGIILAVWAATTLFIIPIGKQFTFVFMHPRVQRNRFRALSVTASLVFGVAGLLLVVPFPLTTTAEGIIAPPEQSEVRAAGDGVIKRLLTTPGQLVKQGQPLIETEDVFLDAEVRILAARLLGLAARYEALKGAHQQVRADLVKEEIAVVQADLNAAEKRLDSLLLHSPADGVFIVERPENLPGLFLRQGDLVGYVLDVDRPTVRVAIPQADIGLVRRKTHAVQVRLAERLDTVVAAKIIRQVPAASNRLPGPALGPHGGGPFPVDPGDIHGVTTLEGIFEVRLQLPIAVDKLGGRVYALFEHGREPLARQWYRRLRQLFLTRFNV